MNFSCYHRQAGKWMLAIIATLGFAVGCGTQQRPPRNMDEIEVTREYYPVVHKRTLPEPVYGRMMWSHLSQPTPIRNKNTAPFLLPTVEFDLRNSSVAETIESLAQALGYRWSYPPEVGTRKVSILMEGTVEEILAEISRQGNIVGEFDHEQRVLRVIDSRMQPQLKP
ncbi:MAG: hypothetical protein PHC51_04630 [bacterium]|nr:hypothetical protein [bacterium]